MPSIYLKRTSGKYYPGRGLTVTVTPEKYDQSNMFRKYKHTFEPLRPGNIWIYKGDYTFWNLVWYNYATLQLDTEYERARLDHAEVYVNVIEYTTPLILVLHFKDSADKSKYWKYSEFSNMIDRLGVINISGLYKFEGDEQLLEKLIEENDETNRSLTYELDKTNGRGKPYSKKFNISKEYINGSGSNRFYKYVHSPINNVRPQKSFVLYNKNLLMKSSTAYVDNIQSQQYTSITVYCSSTNKPLMIELDKLGSKKYLKRIIGGGDTLLWATYEGPVTDVADLLKKIELSLDNKIYVLLDKQEQYQKDSLKELIESSTHKVTLSNIQPSLIHVVPLDLKDSNWDNLGYKYYNHYINPDLSKSGLPAESRSDVMFELVPYISNFQISLFGSGDKREQIFFKPGPGPPIGELLVYFYSKGSETGKPDTVPLMFKLNDKFYGPKERDSYFTGWKRINSITDTEDANVIKTRLDEINKSFNQIDLVNKKSYGIPDLPKGSTISTEFEFKTERVEVACEQVKPTTDSTHGKTCSTDTSASCENGVYSKYIHKTVNKFQLGDIKYKGKVVNVVEKNGKSPINGGKPIEIKHGQNEVAVYYMTIDSTFKYPLLIGIGKQDSSKTIEKVEEEYYKLIPTNGGTSKYKWQKLKEDEKFKKTNGNYICELIKLLDKINYEVKKVLKVEIHKNSPNPYQAMGREGSKPAGGMNLFGPIKGARGKEVKIEVCKTGVCVELSSAGYKCFQHKISSISGFDYNLIGGVAFTVPGQGGEPIEIPLFNGATGGPAIDCNNGQTGKIDPLTYNSCMDDVYVFFYDGTGSGVQPASIDSVPLMLWFNKNYYKPCSRDEYFEKWEQVKELGSAGKPCEGGGGVNGLANKLNEVNKELNRIDLDKSNMASRGTGGGYGLPETADSGIIPHPTQFPTIRVKVTEKTPTNENAKAAYTRIVHRTVNGFQIGDIKYGKKDFVEKGVSINGGSGGGSGTAEISVKNGGHTSLVETHQWNTVVAYYSIGDTEYKLPQLIVILKTNEVCEPVKASEKNYGYYILTSNDAPNCYKYTWREVKNQYSLLTLNDATDFLLLNSVVILLEQQCKNSGNKYGDSELSSSIKSAIRKQPDFSSPGIKDDINRLTGKDIMITVSDATKSTCLNTTGFKLITHDISQLVTLEGQLNAKLPSVTLIAGLRFLIPTILKDDYTELTLYEEKNNGKPTKFVNVITYYQNEKNEICVFFYKQDHRPLLFCYGGSAYRPLDKANYFIRWVKDSTILNCGCKQPCEELIKALVDVSNFLNPLNIKRVPSIKDKKTSCCYQVHWFNGKPIRIKVTSVEGTEKFCYHKYTHTPCSGFRLGTIYYGCNCIKLVPESDSNTNNCITSQLDNANPPSSYKSADKVVVFYYQGDKQLERPLLVALCNKDDSNNCNLFYELQKGDGKGSTVKKYKKGSGTSINVNDTSSGGPLETKLDGIRSKIRKKLQIILDKLPVETLYCFKCAVEKNGQTVDCNDANKGIKCYKADEALKKLQCEIKENGKNKPGCVLLSAGKSLCYEAQMYDSNGNKLPNGSDPTPTTAAKTVKVTLLDCKQLSRHGYKCYMHDLLEVEGKEQIGGLRFFLWDNTKGDSAGSEGAGCNTGSAGSANCPSNNSGGTECRELCLYKENSGDSVGEGSSSCPTASSNNQASCTPDSNLQLIPNFPYTTCKGNVYVFFYGDDPRPLMLCYILLKPKLILHHSSFL